MTIAIRFPRLPPEVAVRSRGRDRLHMATDISYLDELLDRVGAGDRQAFAALYDGAAGAVFGTVKRVLRDPSQAEEVAQEVMIEVWKNAARYDRRLGSAAAWIITIARRRAVDRVRREQAGRARTERVGHGSTQPAYDAVSEAVLDRDERHRVRATLSALTDLQRQAIEMAYLDGRTYRQVAEILELPLGTVKTRIRDGLLKLATAMEASA